MNARKFGSWPSCAILSTLLCLLCTGAMQPADIQMECGEYSQPLEFEQECAKAPGGHSTPADACRAAQLALLAKMLSGIGVACDDFDCAPGSCHEAIYYWTPGQMTTTPFAAADGTHGCTACWIGGEAQVTCTACE